MPPCVNKFHKARESPEMRVCVCARVRACVCSLSHVWIKNHSFEVQSGENERFSREREGDEEKKREKK